MKTVDAPLNRLAGPGRDGAGVLRALVEERDPDEVAGVRLDLAYPHIKLGMEADRRLWHGGRLDVPRNSDKANALLAHGWRRLHFTSGDIRRKPFYVADAVGRQLVLACPA